MSDDTKRKEYDAWGTTSEQMGMGGNQHGMGQNPGGYANQSWQFRSTIDPEELFRKIFGEGGFTGNFQSQDFAESSFGFGAAEEVRHNSFINAV